jgi:hypothetical protein
MARSPPDVVALQVGRNPRKVGHATETVARLDCHALRFGLAKLRAQAPQRLVINASVNKTVAGG